jgi:hypothetical protein
MEATEKSTETTMLDNLKNCKKALEEKGYSLQMEEGSVREGGSDNSWKIATIVITGPNEEIFKGGYTEIYNQGQLEKQTYVGTWPLSEHEGKSKQVRLSYHHVGHGHGGRFDSHNKITFP